MTGFREATINEDERQRTTQPIVTGTSVLAIKYKDGIMMMADTLGSYGSLAMFKHLPRLYKASDCVMIGASGEYSDLQYIERLLESITTTDFAYADNAQLQPEEIHSYLSRVLYNRRSKIEPLWNTVLTGGVDSRGQAFLGFVDLYGSNFVGDVLATGYGQHLALPILREKHRLDMSYDEAKKLLEDCMRILIYRDCRALNSFLLGTVTADKGVRISQPYSLKTEWEYQRFVEPNKA